MGDPAELINVTQKSISDGLSKLPATYDGVNGAPPPQPKPAVVLQRPAIEPGQETQTEETSRLARMAGQAREAPVLFRLQPTAPAKPSPQAEGTAGASPLPRAMTPADGLAAPATMTATAGDATQPTAGDQMRKLTFMTSGPDKDVANPHTLQSPASPYQLMAGAIIAASLVTEFGLAWICHRPGDRERLR